MWSALLRWSLAQGGDDEPSAKRAMSAEDRAFLERVMKEYTVDIAQRLARELEVASKFVGGESSAEACEAALDGVEELTQELDLARDLCKLGGLGVVFQAMESGAATSGVRRAACGVVAAVAQNDEVCQEAIAALGGAERLAAVFERSTHVDERRLAVGALSASLRGHKGLEAAFIESGTAATVLPVALASEPRTAAKAAFLLNAMTFDVSDEDALRRLGPAFDAALEATAFDGSEPSQCQRRDSATRALVGAARASPAFATNYRSRLDAKREETERAAATHPDDESLQDQLQVWAELP